MGPIRDPDLRNNEVDFHRIFLNRPQREAEGRSSKWKRKWQPTPVLLPGKSHGQKSLVGYSPWGRKESDTTERLSFLSYISIFCLVFCYVELNYHPNEKSSCFFKACITRESATITCFWKDSKASKKVGKAL